MKYVDPDFGPKRKSDDHGNKFAMYKTGEAPQRGWPDPADTEWVFADSLCDPGEVP